MVFMGWSLVLCGYPLERVEEHDEEAIVQTLYPTFSNSILSILALVPWLS